MEKEELKERIVLLKTKEALLKAKYDNYLKMPMIKRFLAIQEIYFNTTKELTSSEHALENKIKSECDHPLWFVFSSDRDDMELRVYWTCRCVKCNLVKSARSREFKNYIFGPGFTANQNNPLYLFQEVQFEFESLKEDEKQNDTEIAKNLMLRYSKKTQ